MGGKISPSAVLVIQGGSVRLVNIKNQDSMTKILDMVPDIVNRFVPGKSGETKSEAEKKVDDAIHTVSEGKTDF